MIPRATKDQLREWERKLSEYGLSEKQLGLNREIIRKPDRSEQCPETEMLAHQVRTR